MPVGRARGSGLPLVRPASPVLDLLRAPLPPTGHPGDSPRRSHRDLPRRRPRNPDHLERLRPPHLRRRPPLRLGEGFSRHSLKDRSPQNRSVRSGELTYVFKLSTLFEETSKNPEVLALDRGSAALAFSASRVIFTPNTPLP